LLAQTKALSTAQVEALVPKLFAWSESGNLYPPNLTFLRLSVNGRGIPPHQPIRGLPSWKAFWNLPSLDALEGRPQYSAGEAFSPALLAAQLQPADFRLHPDSPGKAEGPGGKDVGADVDLVGPGPAYERWKKTPEYQEWLKDTRQMKK
jgi:hypothetical protein